jgi:hypothetical protein
MPSELAAPTASERELAARARGLRVAGVPADLLRLIRDQDGIGTLELLRRFYLPNVLGYAYLEHGRSGGLVTRDDRGGWHTNAPVPVDLVEPENLTPDTAGPPALLRSAALDLLRARREVTGSTRVFCIQDECGVAACLAASGAGTVVALASAEELALRWQPWGVHGVTGNLRLVTGFPFGGFDLVICCAPPDDRLLDTAVANLAIYGTLVTGLAGAAHERMEIVTLFSRLESRLIVTDMREVDGLFLLRAVKVPELRGEPDYMRYYVV